MKSKELNQIFKRCGILHLVVPICFFILIIHENKKIGQFRHSLVHLFVKYMFLFRHIDPFIHNLNSFIFNQETIIVPKREKKINYNKVNSLYIKNKPCRSHSEKVKGTCF